jgi:peptidoglycan-associated lipoprotein
MNSMMRDYFILGVLFCLSYSVKAQPVSGYSYEIMLETADTCLGRGDYYNALEWFEKAYQEQRSNELAYTIAHLNKLLRDYQKAETWFSRLTKNRKAAAEYPEALFYAGLMQKQNGKYTEALATLNEFRKNTANDSLKNRALLEITGILQLNEVAPYRAVSATPLDSVNVKYSDGGPALYNRMEMYYHTYGVDSVIYTDEEDLDYESKIVKSTYKEEGGWSKGEPLGIHINRIGYHTGNPTFSKDRQRMYFSRALFTGNKLTSSIIYVSKKEGNEWGAAVEVMGGINFEGAIATHPSIGELYGREVLFFSSNKDGGAGGFDLYYATILSDEQVEEPVNLKSLNTPFDELTPHYRDGTIFFASDGLPGAGGFDLFFSDWNGSAWTKARNMGNGYNSPADDLYLVLDPSGENGFLVSNRSGGKYLKSKTCCDDIYLIQPAIIPVNLIATIGEKRGGIRGSNIRILEKVGEDLVEVANVKNVENNKFDLPLRADKSYIIIAEHPRYAPDTFSLNTVGVTSPKTYEKKFVLEYKPIEPEVEIITINEPIRLNSIYFDYNDDKILKDAEKDLDKIYGLMVDYPEMIIELSSHTDARGTDSYNLKLSQRRADSTKRYLVSKGIVAERIKAVGYGETQILNQCLNDVTCSEEDHQYNRRSEFKIIEGPETITIKKEIVKSPEDIEKERKEKEKKEREALKKPKIEFDSPSANFGRIKKGDKRTHVYTFKNTGDADLKIEMVSGCECSTFEWPTRPIKPGQKSEIKMVFDSKDESGPQDKTLDVIHNGVPPVSTLKFKVNVVE